MTSLPPNVDQTLTQQDAPAKRKKIAAEQAFDWAVYGGISYFTQALAGTLATRWLKYGEGRRYGQMAAEWAGKNVIENLSSKRGLAAVEEANTFVTVTALVSMGNLFVVPVKMIEDRKAEAVRWIEDNLVHPDKSQLTDAQKQEIDTAIHAVENRQKQTWWSLFAGRGGGLATVYFTERALGQSRNKYMQDRCSDAVSGTFRSMGMNKLANSPKTRQYSEIGFVDFFYSTIAAGSLYLYSKLVLPDQKSSADDSSGAFINFQRLDSEEIADDTVAQKSFASRAPQPAQVKPRDASYAQQHQQHPPQGGVMQP